MFRTNRVERETSLFDLTSFVDEVLLSGSRIIVDITSATVGLAPYCGLAKRGVRAHDGYQYITIGGWFPGLAREYVAKIVRLEEFFFQPRSHTIRKIILFLCRHAVSGEIVTCGADGSLCVCPSDDGSTPIDGLIDVNIGVSIGTSNSTIELLLVSHRQLLERLFVEYERLDVDRTDYDSMTYIIEAIIAAVVALDSLERSGSVDLDHWQAVDSAELFRRTRESLGRVDVESIGGGRFSFDKQQDRVPTRLLFKQFVRYDNVGSVIDVTRGYQVPDRGMTFSEPEAPDSGFLWPGECSTLHVACVDGS